MTVARGSGNGATGYQLNGLSRDDIGPQLLSNDGELTPRQAWCLYISHFLSMWNSRIYEYAGVIFAQHSFPGTLLPTSLIGISETICMIFSATALGQWVDSSSNRLRPLVTSIVVNRATVGICCFLWLVISQTEAEFLKRSLFGVILVLGMVEKTTRMSNVLSMERDWIPTLASESVGSAGAGHGYDLIHLNTIIRRIDITCKFLTPLIASGLMAVLPIPATTVPLFIAVFSIISVFIEITGVNIVWRQNSRIQIRKTSASSSQLTTSASHRTGILYTISTIIPAQIAGIKFYFSTSVWPPSFGIAILHASVLDWAGTLITWLLNAGFTYTDVTIAKGAGTIFEIGSTFVFPMAVAFFARLMSASSGADGGAYQMVEQTDKNGEDDEAGPADDSQIESSEESKPAQHKSDLQSLSSTTSSDLRPIVRAGKYGLYSLLAMLIPATISLFYLDAALRSSSPSTLSSPFSLSPLPTIHFFTFLSLSFLGRWVYDLSVTQLTQVSVPESHRSEFGGAEMALIACFQFAHWIASAVWSEQQDFRWLGLGSLGAVMLAVAGFAWWERGWRGK